MAEITRIGFEGRAPNYPAEPAYVANPFYGLCFTIGKTEALGPIFNYSYILDIGGALIQNSTLPGKEVTRGAAIIGGHLHSMPISFAALFL